MLVADPAVEFSIDFARADCQGLSLIEVVRPGDPADLTLHDQNGRQVKAVINGVIFTESQLLQRQKLQQTLKTQTKGE